MRRRRKMKDAVRRECVGIAVAVTENAPTEWKEADERATCRANLFGSVFRGVDLRQRSDPSQRGVGVATEYSPYSTHCPAPQGFVDRLQRS